MEKNEESKAMRTLTYLAIGLSVFLITSNSFAFTDDVRIDFDKWELVSYTNAERIDGCWWNYDDAAPSEVIYKISFPEKAYNSVTFFNGFVSSESPAEYLQTFVGRNLGTWYPVESGSLGKPFKNFVRDTTIASYNGNQMYFDLPPSPAPSFGARIQTEGVRRRSAFNATRPEVYSRADYRKAA